MFTTLVDSEVSTVAGLCGDVDPVPALAVERLQTNFAIVMCVGLSALRRLFEQIVVLRNLSSEGQSFVKENPLLSSF
jgi:hypothetical protein